MRTAFRESFRFGLLALMALGQFAPAIAGACSCAEDYEVRLLTATDRPLPRNVQLRVRVPRYGVMLPGLQPGDNMPRPEEMRISLRPLPSGGELKLVEQRAPTGDGVMLLLTPQAPLRARTQYEVLITHDKRRVSLGKLQIGDREDRVAPSAVAIQSSIYHAADRSRSFDGSCSTGHATVSLQLGPFTDDGDGNKKGALYLLWLASDDLAIDFRKPSSQGVVLSPDRSTIQLGISHLCSRGWDWRPAPNQTELRIGLITYDEAGNASAPVEHRVPLKSIDTAVKSPTN